MESEATIDHGSSSRENLLVPLLILTFLICSWLVYAYVNTAWFEAFDQVVAWILNPVINYSPLQIEGLPWAILATLEILILGFAGSFLLLRNEKDFTLKVITTIGLGAGITGIVSIILGILGLLYQFQLNIVLLSLIVIFSIILIYRVPAKNRFSIKSYFSASFFFSKFHFPPNAKFWLPSCVAIGIIFSFVLYHALSTVIVHWDALVYHAAMANIMYTEHLIPIITGPSIGIEMSANFPPLYSALGAFYYTQIGSIQDIYLRLIPPVMGALTVLATYKIGGIVAGKKFGLISALILTITPLFFRYSIFETSYSTLTFFCTSSILFLLLAITKGDTKYWVTCGLLYGFGLLTSYLAIYLAPFFAIALFFYLSKKGNFSKINTKKVVILISSALIISGVWFLRNYILVGNPIYPNAYTVLGGLNIDPLIEQTTFNGIKLSSTLAFFGEQQASLFDKIMVFLTFRIHFPSLSLLTILGLVLLSITRNKKFWLIAAWPLTLSLFVISGISWGFPRHMIVAMPGFALISALPIFKILEICKKHDTIYYDTLHKISNNLPRVRKSDFIRIGLVIVLLATFLFPSLTLIMGGKINEESLNDTVADDYLWFLKNPNGNTWTALDQIYPEAQGWRWLNEHLNEGEKFATVENRIYYIKNCSNDCFFYLDGWEARELYNITDPALMVQFLKNQNVTYVLDVAWARWHGHFDILPMAKYLGSPSPYFPTIFDNASNPAIYNVGPFDTPITNQSPVAVSINQQGWSKLETINGVKTQSVIAENESARLYIATPNFTKVSITYLDVGKEEVAINFKRFNTSDWINGYAAIQKTNSGKWQTFDFFAPITDIGFVELALHAYKENFTISKISAEPYQSTGRIALNSINSTLSVKMSEDTIPQAITVYLPMLNRSEVLQINATSPRQPICLELYEGVIQPWENTKWWLNHELVVRSPDSIDDGQIDPTLICQVKKLGFCTLIIVPREGYRGNVIVDLQISGFNADGGSVK